MVNQTYILFTQTCCCNGKRFIALAKSRIMWHKTRITELLGIDYPILAGPMGGGFSTPELTANVSNAGGLGSYGAYTFTADEMRAFDAKVRALTSKPYNINLWVNDVDAQRLKDYTPAEMEKVKALYKSYFDEVGIPLPELSTNIPSKFEQQAEALLKIKPAVFSFIFGIPDAEILAECRRLNIKTVGSATTLDEGLALEAAGVDAIIAAGFEAGGHRPSFLLPAPDSLTGTFALVQQLRAKLKTPIIASGGIADGRGIAAALTLGADAAQLGSAFLACKESNATPQHKALLLNGGAKHTMLSKSLTGRLGRMIGNRISTEVPYETDVLPFPLQTRFLAPLKNAALAQGKTDLVNMWAGQNTVSLQHATVGDLMGSLVREAGEVMGD